MSFLELRCEISKCLGTAGETADKSPVQPLPEGTECPRLGL